LQQPSATPASQLQKSKNPDPITSLQELVAHINIDHKDLLTVLPAEIPALESAAVTLKYAVALLAASIPGVTPDQATKVGCYIHTFITLVLQQACKS
jgi:hypothetical protein